AGCAGGKRQDERGAARRRRQARAGRLGRRAARAGTGGRLRRDPGVHRPGARTGARAADRARARDRLRRDARARPALPALDGTAAQGRSEHRALPAGGRRPGRRAEDSRAEIRLRPTDTRAGDGRLRVAEGARPEGRARATRGGYVVQLGMIGLGRMGGNMTIRLEQHGHDMKTYDPGIEATAVSLAELRDQLDQPRAFWMMIPAGKITESTFHELLTRTDEGDAIVDGGQ